MSNVVSKNVKIMSLEADTEKHALIINQLITVSKPQKDGSIKEEGTKLVKSLPLRYFVAEDIEQLTDDLMTRIYNLESGKRDQLRKCLRQLCGNTEDVLASDADIANLNQYASALYEDMKEKIAATQYISILARDSKNQKIISYNQTVLAAMARTLREDGLKDMQLGTNITSVFFELSANSGFGQVLIEYKAPDSLIKMIEHENKRYTVLYKDLADKKKKIGDDDAKRQEYLRQYESFKQLTLKQDCLLEKAINTLINLIEVSSAQQGKPTLFMAIDKLVAMLAYCMKRKPINMNLLVVTSQVMQTISTLPDGLKAIQKAELLNSLLKIVMEDDGNQVDAVLTLLYNLTFDPGLLQELKEKQFSAALVQYIGILKRRFLNKYKGEYAENDDFPTKINKIAKNSAKHSADNELYRMVKQLNLYANTIAKFGDEFPEELIVDLTGIVCGLKQPPPYLLYYIAQLSYNPQIALRIAQSGLLDPLTTQFEATKNEHLAKIFSNVTAAMPLEAIDVATRDGTSSKDEVRGQKQRNMVDYIVKIANIALSSNDDRQQSEALAMIAHLPPKMIETEYAQLICKLALQKLALPSNYDIVGKMKAVSVINNFMKKYQTAYIFADDHHLKDLPVLLLSSLGYSMNAKGYGSFDANIGQFGLEFDKMEIDYAIETLICILRSCAYKAMRRNFIKTDNFLIMIVRFLYNLPVRHYVSYEETSVSQQRNEHSEYIMPGYVISYAKGRSSKMANRVKRYTSDGIVFRSFLETPELRAGQILEQIAGTILDVLILTEENVAERIKMLRWYRYNWEFFSSRMQEK